MHLHHAGFSQQIGQRGAPVDVARISMGECRQLQVGLVSRADHIGNADITGGGYTAGALLGSAVPPIVATMSCDAAQGCNEAPVGGQEWICLVWRVV